MFSFQLPTTSSFVFSDICSDHTNDRSLSQNLSDASQARSDVKSSLKQSKKAKDYLNLVKTLDDYIPHLTAVIQSVEHDLLSLNSDPKFAWSSPISSVSPSHLNRNKQRFDLPSIHAELAFALLAYAYALSNLARTSVIALGDYENTPGGLLESQRKEKDAKLTWAVGILTKAAGVFEYVPTHVLSQCHLDPAIVKRPIELDGDVCRALSKMTLASAQTLAIRKLLSPSASTTTYLGPPLPSGHPSPSLLAKLHLETASLYSSSHSSLSSSASSDLRRYLSEQSKFHTTLAHTWLGIDAGENGGRERGGEAVAWLSWSKKQLHDLSSFSLPTKDDEEDNHLSSAVLKNAEKRVEAFYKHYKKTNQSMHFQPVPSVDELKTKVPAGRLAVAVRPYQPPLPAFGPGVHADDGPEEEKKGTYAGAGAYF